VYTLFGPPLPPASSLPSTSSLSTSLPGRTCCPLLQFCWRENIRDNKKDIAFLLASTKIGVKRDY
jgi:hypothetical protein